MDLNDHHFAKDEAQDDDNETSVQILRREREERRRRLRLRRDESQPLEREEGPFLKKLKCDNPTLPPGWLHCPKFGQDIGRIIPSKVPIEETNAGCSEERYSFRHVFRMLRVKGIELGMIVDLTNTDRYYSSRELEKEGLKYLKIRCQGHNAVPDNESVNTFVFEVAQFIFSQIKRRSKKYVFVHCTHGHNRTGYMIVHYLMRTQQASCVTEAIQRFANARPPGIYKQDYIDALYTFYHETKSDLVLCPSTPEWKRSRDFDLNCEPLPKDDDGLPYGSINETQENCVTMTNDDVLGDKIPVQQEHQLQRFCCGILKVKGLSFPGSHPVSLSRKNLELLRQRYYYATWKADGTRYMMLLCRDGAYLVDRCFNFRRVQMKFPRKIMTERHHFTLLDGEMIIDTVSPHKQERRYLIYDLIAINCVSVAERPFFERWNIIEKEVIEPRKLERKTMDSRGKPPYRYELEPFRVRRKDFWLLSTTGKLLKEFIPNLSHEADGLVFQCWEDPYVPKKHEGLLKWKYPKMNSVDFLFEMGENGRENLYLYDNGKKRLLEHNGISFRDADPSLYAGKIVECSFDLDKGVWVFMRVRTDKDTPNAYYTYLQVMQSIKDNLTEEIVLNEIEQIIRLPMYADRDPIDSRARAKAKPPLQKNGR